jgi:hypothetical protein
MLQSRCQVFTKFFSSLVHLFLTSANQLFLGRLLRIITCLQSRCQVFIKFFSSLVQLFLTSAKQLFLGRFLRLITCLQSRCQVYTKLFSSLVHLFLTCANQLQFRISAHSIGVCARNSQLIFFFQNITKPSPHICLVPGSIPLQEGGAEARLPILSL